MNERPERGRLDQAGRLVVRGALIAGRGLGHALKRVLTESTIDTGRGPRKVGDWLSDHITIVPDHHAALVRRYPPRRQWRSKPRLGGIYRSEDAALQFFGNGTLRWTTGRDWTEGTWRAADGEIEVRTDGWLMTGPIGEDRLYLSAFRAWRSGETEAVVAEFVFGPG